MRRPRSGGRGTHRSWGLVWTGVACLAAGGGLGGAAASHVLDGWSVAPGSNEAGVARTAATGVLLPTTPGQDRHLVVRGSADPTVTTFPVVASGANSVRVSGHVADGDLVAPLLLDASLRSVRVDAWTVLATLVATGGLACGLIGFSDRARDPAGAGRTVGAPAPAPPASPWGRPAPPDGGWAP